MTTAFHIVEPTFNSTAGHCHTVVHSLAVAARQYDPDIAVHVWSGHRLSANCMADADVCLHPLFHRRIRRLQLWWLLGKLARSGQRVLLPTAGRSELALFAALPASWRKQARIWFYLHQLRMDGARGKRLQLLGERLPDARILCTHKELQRLMQAAGFRHARLQPCPFEPPQHAVQTVPFKHIIFPGEARLDKNLPFLVDLLRHMRQQRATIPVMIQAAPNHHGVFAPAIQRVLDALQQVGYAHLTMPARAFDGEEYLAQFSGGICLQPYRVEDYASKISGITLDALTRGCPCIAMKGTWPAEVAGEFAAGVVCERLDAAQWYAAINTVIRQYAVYQQRCQQAMQVLTERHHPLRTLETLWSEA